MLISALVVREVDLPGIKISGESELRTGIHLMRTGLCSEARFLLCQINSFYSGTSRAAALGTTKVKLARHGSTHRLNSPSTGRSTLAGGLA